MQWYFDVLKKYAVFSGRARRKEYWFFALFQCIIIGILALVSAVADSSAIKLIFGSLYAIYVFGTLIPSIAVTVRRLHDIGRSGWWYFIVLVPLVGPIVLVVFTVMDSKPEENQYGVSPKALATSPFSA